MGLKGLWWREKRYKVPLFNLNMVQKREVIKLKNVSKIYDMGETKVHALSQFDISVKEGEFIAIMGPSGSGKSTAMNLVGSLDTPTIGDIYLDGVNVSTLHESSLAQIRGKKIGFIFQTFNLIPTLTVKGNVMLPMMFQGLDEFVRANKAEDVLKMVELDDRMNHYPNQLSGGQRQRVAIARALANDPEVILADEPTGNLDTKTGEIVLAFLDKLHDEGKTIIMVTHDSDLAQKHAETIYWLKDGKLDRVTKGKKKGKR